jgi:hypothetical protein
MEDFEKWWQALVRINNNDKDETSLKILNDHSGRIDQLTKRVDALFAQPLVHHRPPPSPNSLNSNNQRYQDSMGCLNKVKIDIPKYDGVDDNKI